MIFEIMSEGKWRKARGGEDITKNDVIEFLADCGIEFPGGSYEPWIKYQGKRFPTLSFRRDEVKIVLKYQGPQGYGLQQFKFEPSQFKNAYQKSKNKHLADKDEYMSFSFLFFENEFDDKVTKRARMIFSLFNITPTIINRVMHQNKNMKRVIRLEPKIKHIQKFLFGVHNYSAINNQYSHDVSITTKKKLEEVDKEELMRITQNMDILVLKAANDCNINEYFNLYVEAYNEKRVLFGKQPINTKHKICNVILKEFVNKVNQTQKQHFIFDND